jgi:hypothetical protein
VIAGNWSNEPLVKNLNDKMQQAEDEYRASVKVTATFEKAFEDLRNSADNSWKDIDVGRLKDNGRHNEYMFDYKRPSWWSEVDDLKWTWGSHITHIPPAKIASNGVDIEYPQVKTERDYFEDYKGKYDNWTRFTHWGVNGNSVSREMLHVMKRQALAKALTAAWKDEDAKGPTRNAYSNVLGRLNNSITATKKVFDEIIAIKQSEPASTHLLSSPVYDSTDIRKSGLLEILKPKCENLLQSIHNAQGNFMAGEMALLQQDYTQVATCAGEVSLNIHP